MVSKLFNKFIYKFGFGFIILDEVILVALKYFKNIYETIEDFKEKVEGEDF